ncbi:MAG: carbohydrate kinase family protein [Nanoarchaeota archaeon]|nr:carbohydrate kinase family protein [Nanoarchaeota archaeon]
MYDVITVGSATVDIFVKTHYSKTIKKNKKKGIKSDLQAYPIGSKILIDKMHETVGGGGINSAIALKRLGHKVAFLGNVGTGNNANFILNKLKKDNVLAIAPKDKEIESGTSIILDSIEHDRTILTFKGANDHLRWKDIKKIPKTKWFYFSTMLKESWETQKKLAAYAKKNNIHIIFNMSEYLAEKGLTYCKPILRHTTIFVCNKQEARILTKKKNMNEIVRTLSKAGPKIVIITDGNENVIAYDQLQTYQLATKKVKVVETTGAGDAFASSFLSGMIKRNDIKFALQLARTNAESVIQHHGATNKLLTFKQACKEIKKPTKIIIT